MQDVDCGYNPPGKTFGNAKTVDCGFNPTSARRSSTAGDGDAGQQAIGEIDGPAVGEVEGMAVAEASPKPAHPLPKRR